MYSIMRVTRRALNRGAGTDNALDAARGARYSGAHMA
jgi:hypothetical protein